MSEKGQAPKAKDSSSTSIRLDSDALAIAKDTARGSFVIANRSLQAGEILLECPSASIALDHGYRTSHCGFCATEIQQQQQQVAQSSTCQGCRVLATCHHCRETLKDWHAQSGECAVLQCLVEGFGKVFLSEQVMTAQDVSPHIDPIYIITMRLAHRRQLDRHNGTTTQNSTTTILPSIDWNLLDQLYSSPLPANHEGNAVVSAMAQLLQVMTALWKQKKQQIPFCNPQECVSIWNKCRGCCHAITDLTRPLGAQNLGMALFLPHSFYNHACAPNAFLSCMLPSSKQQQHSVCEDPTSTTKQQQQQHTPAVVARVVCINTIAKGDPVSLSYIPLSGLCRLERRLRLQETYHFVCDCSMCSNQEAIERHVGGDFATGKTASDVVTALLPLRELQIDCYQTLTLASSMENKDEVMDVVEQCMATLTMAQRGIRNQQIPASHEVALECHRLLAVAHSLLRGDNNHEKDQELHHHREFFGAAEQVEALMDPSALAIQHGLAAQCLQSKLQDHSDDATTNEFQKELLVHRTAAIEISTRAVGGDHPFVHSLQQSMGGCSETQPTDSALGTRKRQLSQNGD
ncbi:expressed unknown protein [Seminavis robusta]|uniref:SET domain-containing protein n=1 Tax=Seminavis robusta TaxID=568900 RepID=A0A9N8DI71_9STRA|nr:expressed unknown protein [Seminavis robusta]|eukprot:Sro102_g052140.1 n/a (575) ;mRNA; f:82232-83956